MLHGVEMKSAVHELRLEGFAFLYRGILPPLAQRTVSLSLMFGLYDGTKKPLVKLGFNEYVAKFIAGMTAGKFDSFILNNKNLEFYLNHNIRIHSLNFFKPTVFRNRRSCSDAIRTYPNSFSRFSLSYTL